MKKRWPIVIALSILAGITGKKLLAKQEELVSKPNNVRPITLFSGSWWFTDPKKHIQHKIIIANNLSFVLDDRVLETRVTSLTNQQLAIQDQYGYHIVFSYVNDMTLELYDEADDSTYILKKCTP